MGLLVSTIAPGWAVDVTTNPRHGSQVSSGQFDWSRTG